MEVLRYFWPIFSLPSDMARPVPSHDYVLVNRSILCNCHIESGLSYLLKSIAFYETARADYTMSFALNLAFLHMIQDLWPGNFSQWPSVVTKEELTFPLGLTSNADFCGQIPRSQWDLPHHSYAWTTISVSFVLQSESKGCCPFWQKIPFYFWPQAGLPHWTS